MSQNCLTLLPRHGSKATSTQYQFVLGPSPARLPGTWRVSAFSLAQRPAFLFRIAMHPTAAAGSHTTRTGAAEMSAARPTRLLSGWTQELSVRSSAWTTIGGAVAPTWNSSAGALPVVRVRAIDPY